MADIDLLIIVPQARQRNIMWPPYGAMHVATALIRKGFKVQILNNDVERLPNSELIAKVADIDPKYIGFSGMVATSYKYIKDLSLDLKKVFPQKLQILGGGLSCAAETLLRHSGIEVVVKGEADITAPELLECLNTKGYLGKVLGIYYEKDKEVVFTGTRRLIHNIDELGYPAFDLVDMKHYLVEGVPFINTFVKDIKDERILDPKRKKKMINILTNRGCIGACSFCVRPDAGLRMNSLEHIFNYIEYCVRRFDIGFISFGDECFAPTKERNWEFIEGFKKRKLDVVFRILGLRVDAVDKEILQAYKDIGCWMINYGFESGSQKMLNIIDKRVTVEQNRQAAIWTKEAGIYTPPQLILGMPGEDERTIDETIKFMKSIDFGYKQYKWTYALPIPGSHLYDFAVLSGAIKDEDEYLTSIGDIEGTGVFHVNLTDSTDAEVLSWSNKLKTELDSYFFTKQFKTTNRLIIMFAHVFSLFELHLRRKDLFLRAVKKLKGLFIKPNKEKIDVKADMVRYRKNEGIKVDELIRGESADVVNRNISLKAINLKITGNKNK